MSLLVQELLRSGMTPAELYERHRVHCKPHNGKASFIYDQIEAKASDPVATQCRGLVLREGSWDVVARPFDRFFNLGQPEAEGLDLTTAAFEEKLDGTLIIAYWDAGAWHTATRSLTEAQLGQEDWTFRSLAERACVEMGFGGLQAFMSDADRELTHCFELTAPENQVVCEYRERRLTLLGARVTATGEELPTGPIAERHGFGLPRTWQLDNLDHVVEVIRDWDPGELEGIVAKDAKFHRVKVKSPRYLAVHHATDSLGTSWRSCMRAVVTGAADDIGRYLPAFVSQRIEVCRARLTMLVAETEQTYAPIAGIESMKEFASHATKTKCPPALFSVKRGQCGSIAEFYAQYEPRRLVELCGLDAGEEDEQLTEAAKGVAC